MKPKEETPPTTLSRLIVIVVVILGLLALVSYFGSRTPAQELRPQPKQYQRPGQPAGDSLVPSIIVSPGEDYRIGPSDVIEVLIEDAPELSRTLRVNAEGTVLMPFLGRVAAQQKTPDELAKAIADRLRGEYLEDPQVSVTVTQINSRTYFVQGAVRRAGLYQIEGQPSLLKLITIAGGLSENYGSTAYIIREITAQGLENRGWGLDKKQVSSDLFAFLENRPSTASSHPSPPASGSDAPAGARYELIKVNINGLLRGNFDQNVTIEPGDIVHIPATDVFFVAGEVNAPGSFVLKDGTTVRQAISLAQGTSFNAAGDRGMIFREDPTNGKRIEIKVDIPAVMNGKKEDVAILANDIVIVPNSRLKSVGGTLLRAFGVNSARLPVRYGY
jgi:polysaccharide export outer membrane protein